MLHRRVGLGQVPRRRSDRKRCRCLRVELEPPDAEFTARDGEEWRQLHELAVDQDGSFGQRIRRRHRVG